MSTYRAIVGASTLGVGAIVDLPRPSVGADEILVSVKAVALNPTDWKHRDYFTKENEGLGCDFAGEVIEIGSAVKNVVVGENVAGFAHGGRYEGVGAFAELVLVEAVLVWKVAKGINLEEAAAMGGVGPDTAVQALNMRHRMATPDAPLKVAEPFLIWSGATSVGMYAIQIAALSGYTVITTASPKNFALVKSLGATAVYDYSDPTTPAQIAAAYPTLSKALDGISEQGTTALVAASMKGKDAHIVTLLPVAPAVTAEFPAVTVESTLAYGVLGKAFDWPGWAYFPASPSDKAAIIKWLALLPELLAAGKFKPNPIWSQPGGLDGVLPALELLKAGKTSGNKITLAF